MSSGSRCEASRKFFMQRALEAMMPIEILGMAPWGGKDCAEAAKRPPAPVIRRQEAMAWMNYAPLDTVSSRLTASISLIRFS